MPTTKSRRQTDDEEQNEEPNRPVRNLKVRRHLRRDLDQQPTDGGVTDGDLRPHLQRHGLSAFFLPVMPALQFGKEFARIRCRRRCAA